MTEQTLHYILAVLTSEHLQIPANLAETHVKAVTEARGELEQCAIEDVENE